MMTQNSVLEQSRRQLKLKCNKTVISFILAIQIDFLADLYNSVLLVVGGGGLLLPCRYSLVNRGFKLN